MRRLVVVTTAFLALLNVLSIRENPDRAIAEIGCAFERIRTREVYLDQASNALTRVAAGKPKYRFEALRPAPLERTPDGSVTEAATFPPTLVRAISYVESTWAMANWDTPRGKVGPVLTSSSCAYGVMQVLSGMQVQPGFSGPTPMQRAVLRSPVVNIQAGLQLLADKWNFSGTNAWPWVGDRNPAILEHWYYATWAYYGMLPVMSPANPDYPWPRPTYNSTACRSQPAGCQFTHYPYQELVLGLVANPPIVGAVGEQPVTLWTPRKVRLPDRNYFLTVASPKAPAWPPPVIKRSPGATRDAGPGRAPRIALEQPALTLEYASGDPSVVALPVVTVLNAGGGVLSPVIAATQNGPTRDWLTTWTTSSQVAPAAIMVSFTPSSMSAGSHTATFTISSLVARESPQTFTLTVCIDHC